jgi:hypothetical protein
LDQLDHLAEGRFGGRCRWIGHNRLDGLAHEVVLPKFNVIPFSLIERVAVASAQSRELAPAASGERCPGHIPEISGSRKAMAAGAYAPNQ